MKFSYVGDIELLPTCSGVYMGICDENNYTYIGKTDNSIRGRVRREFQGLKNKDKEKFNNKKMQIDFDKYGEEHFSWYLLCKCSGDEAIYIEDYYIKKFNSIAEGYNNRYGDINKIKCYEDTKRIALGKVDNEIRNILSTLLIDIFDKNFWYMIRYSDFIKQLKCLICEDITEDIIFELMKKERFRFFIRDKYYIYYEISFDYFKDFMNNNNYHHVLLDEDDILIDNIYISAPSFKKNERVEKYVEEYKNKIRERVDEYERIIKERNKQYLRITKECQNAKICYKNSWYFNKLYKLRKEIDAEIKNITNKKSKLYTGDFIIGNCFFNRTINYEDDIIDYRGFLRG